MGNVFELRVEVLRETGIGEGRLWPLGESSLVEVVLKVFKLINISICSLKEEVVWN